MLANVTQTVGFIAATRFAHPNPIAPSAGGDTEGGVANLRPGREGRPVSPKSLNHLERTRRNPVANDHCDSDRCAQICGDGPILTIATPGNSDSISWSWKLS